MYKVWILRICDNNYCKDEILMTQATKNSEGQPKKPKTINLLESGFYKQTTKPCNFKLIEIDTQIQ